MSFAALSWVLDEAACPSSQVFATMIVFANFANEHGRSYPSTNTVAAKSRQNPKTVRAAIDAAEAAGLLIDTGVRVGASGHVKVYALGMEGIPKVGALRGEVPPDTSVEPSDGTGDDATKAHPNTGAPSSDARAPVFTGRASRKRVGEPVREPVSPEDANASSAPDGAKKPVRADGSVKWTAPSIRDLPSEVQAIAAQWPSGAYEAEAAGHAAWLAGRRRRGNLAASWHARIVQLGAKPMQAARSGLRYGTAPAAAVAPAGAVSRCGTAGEGELAEALRGALQRRAGSVVFDRWLGPCRYDFRDDGLTVIAPSGFVLGWVRSNYATAIEADAGALLAVRPVVSWEVGEPA